RIASSALMGSEKIVISAVANNRLMMLLRILMI
ncbi:MAG: hypothetical protein ACI89Z_001023, partial [Porticoccus sp.]